MPLHVASVFNTPTERRRRVLVAEDDPSIRRLMSIALRADAFDVEELPDGGALLERLASMLLQTGQRHPPIDLLVVDLWMPRLDGLKVLSGLQRTQWHPPVVVVTADPHPVTHARAIDLGAAAVFKKPFDLDDFRTAVTHYSRAA